MGRDCNWKARETERVKEIDAQLGSAVTVVVGGGWMAKASDTKRNTNQFTEEDEEHERNANAKTDPNRFPSYYSIWN